MEFFERAHIVKKDMNNSDESVKKQLKQMLHGYKNSDNKIIKEAGTENHAYEDLVSGFDDSSSVSGFSDLNLTNSSNEGDKSLEIPTNNIIRLNKKEGTASNSLSTNEKFSSEEESFKVNFATIPEDDEDDCSLSENTHLSPDTHLSSSNGDSEILPFYDLEITTSSELASSDSEFDRDGELALKIIKKLEKNKDSNFKGKRISDKVLKESNISDKPVKLHNTILDKQHIDTATSNISEKVCDELILDKSYTEDSPSVSQHCSMSSSQFVSLTAEDMPDQSLSEILGEYRYSTMKNLPCDKQNIINSSLFTNTVDSAEIQVEDDIDSLIPELDEDPTIEDLEMDVDVDLSLQQTNEDITNVCDSNIQSEELFTNKEDSPQSVENSNDHVNPVKVYHGKNNCIFVLKHPSKIYIHGKVRIKVIGGTAEAYGYILKNNYCDLYAPNYNCAQYIKTVESQDMYYGLFGKLTSSGLSVKDAEQIVTELGEYDAVISMSRLNCPKMDFVENNFKTIDLFSKQNKKIDDCFKQASEALGCSLYLMPVLRVYEVNSYWEHVINRTGNEGRTIILGGKGLGKSTCLRYYVNRLLANGPVLVIDLDPGQAEFTVAGHVSVTVVTKPLLGPSFTHLAPPDLMLNIGMISTMDNPSRYVNAITEVVAHCRSSARYKSMPWIVNTMGMTNNMGLKFITLIITHIQPTVVLQINNKNIKSYGTELHPDKVKKLLNDFRKDKLFKDVVNTDLRYKFFMYSREDSDIKSMSLAAREERYLNYLAYFGELMNVHKGPGLLGIVPYEVKLDDLNIGINVKMSKDAVTKVINGKIIALCQLTTLDKGKVFVLGDNAVRCLGHGLIRSVDFEKGLLYIITPTHMDTLLLVNMLVYADWVPELVGEERRLPDGTAVPYRAASVNYKQKQLMFAPRRRFNPLQLLKSRGIPKLKPSVIC